MIYSIQKAMQILSILSDEKNQPVPLADIAMKTGYPKPTCSHILETLCHDGYVVRISQSKGYILGPAVYYLARYGRYKEELVYLCKPIMHWMEKKSHATVVLSVIQSNQKFIIDYFDTEQNIFFDHPRIQTDDIYRTATGRAILAHMSREEVRAIWEKYGKPQPNHWDEVDSYESLLDNLKSIKKQKVVISGATKKEGVKNAVGYASPIFQRTTCIGAVGLAWNLMPNDTAIDSKTEEMLCSILLKGVKEIHRRISYDK